MTTAEKLQKIAENEQKVYDVGQTDERKRFWNILQNNGGTQNYYVAFAYGKFTDENYNPIHPIRCSNGTTPGQQMFYNSTGITDTKVAIYANSNNLTQAFANSYIRRIPLLSVKSSTTYPNTFAYCEFIEDITFDGTIGKDISFAYCKKLNKASITSVMTHILATATLSATFSKIAIDKAFETSSGANDGSTSSEWLALVDALPNATIDLT